MHPHFREQDMKQQQTNPDFRSIKSLINLYSIHIWPLLKEFVRSFLAKYEPLYQRNVYISGRFLVT